MRRLRASDDLEWYSMPFGAAPDCPCGRGHNLFGWFWSAEMQRIHDAHEEELEPTREELPPEKVLSLKDLFDSRMRNK